MRLTFEDRPIDPSYRARHSGRDLGDSMPMWRVQTEGYLDGKGMRIGVVCPRGLEDSPDGEIISGGLNTKGADSVAIGRQGNFLHWGFAASPTYLTDEAKLVFVNAIHYIRAFKGQRAFVRRKSYFTRSTVDDLIHRLSDEGFEAMGAVTDQMNARRAEMAEEIKKRQERGEKVSEWERQLLTTRPTTASRKRSIEAIVPEGLQRLFGDDWRAYVDYYRENRPYFYPVDTGDFVPKLHVDDDVRKLGLPNHEIRMIEKCVTLLETDHESELAQRVLRRYTTESFDSAADWRRWLNTVRGQLFFTEVGGFKFLVNPERVAPRSDTLQEAIDRLQVSPPTSRHPVQWSARLVPESAGVGETVNLVVKARILPGWHIYAQAPSPSAYLSTKLDLNRPTGLTAIGDWVTPPTRLDPASPGTSMYEGECVFRRELRVEERSPKAQRIEVTVSYQACNERRCLTPAQARFSLPIRP